MAKFGLTCKTMRGRAAPAKLKIVENPMFIFMTLFLFSEPMNVKVDDSIMDLDLYTEESHNVKLKDVVSNSFCFFISTRFKICEESMLIIEQIFPDSENIIFLVEGKPDLNSFAKTNKGKPMLLDICHGRLKVK